MLKTYSDLYLCIYNTNMGAKYNFQYVLKCDAKYIIYLSFNEEMLQTMYRDFTSLDKDLSQSTKVYRILELASAFENTKIQIKEGREPTDINITHLKVFLLIMESSHHTLLK